MNKANCIIIHGCPSDKEKAADPEARTYDKHWLPWTKRELERHGLSTEIPLMPNPWIPDYSAYAREFEKYTVTDNTTVIGTSCGAAFLVRWLGESKCKVRKLILVAPWKLPDKDDDLTKDFYTYPIDPEITSRVESVAIFTSDNEEDDGKKSVRMFHEVLGGKIINLPGRGHYILRDMKTEEFPELVAEVLN